MQKYYLDRALNAVREMIRSQYINRNVDGMIKHLSPENFSFVGFIEGNVFDSAASFIEYAQKSSDQLLSYELIDENYSVCSESDDSCQIRAQITFAHARTQKAFVVNHFFYFNRLGAKIICTHLHISRQFDMNKDYRLVLLNETAYYPKLPWEILSYGEDLLEFMNSGAVSEKSFVYDDDFQYLLVNMKFIELLGYKSMTEFAREQNNSSLANINEADRAGYVEYLKKRYENNLIGRDAVGECQPSSTYYVSYRLKSPYLVEEVRVLECGNFFTQNGRTTINSFVLNLNEAEKISANQKFNSSVREDCGIHIKQNVIIYPRSHRIKIDSKIIALTPFEGEIFLVLLDNLNRPVMPKKIYETIYKNSSMHITSNVLPMHISNIRRKLSFCKDLIQIVFVKAGGYCLRM